ncbi:MAG: peptidoglycan editing factor PgeF [Chloroflexota bacterium]|jgi:polyphenol oxidase
MQQQVQNEIRYFQFESLLRAGNGRIQHAIFGRQGGVSPAPFDSLNLSVSVPDKKERVYANRRRAFGLFGRDTDTLVHAHLVHGRTVARVASANNGTWAEHVDAIITNEPGCGLTMNFADCTPILLYDPVRQAIGLGHAGWQGCVVDLPGAMVQAMQTEFGSRPDQLWAGIGPSIGPCCYEVGEPVIGAVHEAFARPDQFLLPQPDRDRPHFDLPQANRRNLIRAGLPAAQIEMPGLCTACHTDLFFSHRAENGRTGRFGSIFLLPASQ